MRDPDAVGIATLTGNRPFVTIFLQIREGKVGKAAFKAIGCGVTMACCSVLTEMVVGQSPDQCSSLTAADIIDSLEGLPLDKHFCAELAVESLRRAVERLRER